MLIINGKVYTDKRVIENGYVLTEGTKIVSFGDMKYVVEYDGDIIDAMGNNIVPGFIDQHIHGANGADSMDADRDGLINMVNFLPKEGTTSFLPTTMTQSFDEIENALSVIADYMETDNKPGETEILGVHLEGPFLSAKHVGAQNPAFLQVPTREKFDLLNKAARGHIKLITYAPEEAEDGFTDYLCANGIVPSAGHTDADFAVITKAMHEGLSNLTHFHNAMLPHHHRVPGAVTAGFVYPALKAELIVDGIHVHPDSVNATYVIKGADNVIAITDSMRAKGLPDGQYDLGGQTVTKVGKECRIESGSLAGSVAEMDFIARNLRDFTGCSMEELIKMTSTNSAKQIGVYDRKGSISLGKDADLLILSDNIEVITTVCRGVIAFQK